MKQNRTVNRVLAILELLAKYDEGPTLGQIYRELDIPKATAYDFLQTLYKADAIYYKDPRLKNYVIGSKMFAIGSVYAKNSSLIEAAQYDLKDYADKHGRTVFITKRVNDKIVYVFKYQPSNSKVITPQEIGSASRDFKTDVIGQCYSVFDKKVKDTSITDYEMIYNNGFILSNNQNASHICTIAVPVWNVENRVCGVLAASALQEDDTNRELVTSELVEISKQISRRLGYQGDFND
jgi:IclR family transcriptional regulator, KDG regulon repressor